MFSGLFQDVLRMFPGCSDGSCGPGGSRGSFRSSGFGGSCESDCLGGSGGPNGSYESCEFFFSLGPNLLYLNHFRAQFASAPKSVGSNLPPNRRGAQFA